jgi:hypothetical protein
MFDLREQEFITLLGGGTAPSPFAAPSRREKCSDRPLGTSSFSLECFA